VGKHSEEIGQELSEKQIAWEKDRPERIPLEEFCFHNEYGEMMDG
jgi:hypothetical protein